MKKITILLLAAVMLVSSLCGGVASADASGKDTVNYGLTAAITDLNPFNAIQGEQNQFFPNLYTTLVQWIVDENGRFVLVGNLADSWENTNDGKTWVFHLNEKATFSNGEPVTAEDVKFAFEQMALSPYTMAYVEMVTSVDALDEHTVAVNMESFNARAPYCWNYVFVVNAKAYAADPEAYIGNPITSGPFTITKHNLATNAITITRRDDYWGEMPSIREVNLVVKEDADTLVIALQNGEIDCINLFNTTSLPLVEADPNLCVVKHPTDYTGQVIFNTQAEPLDNKLVRQAISYAINWPLLAMVKLGSPENYQKLTTLLYVPAVDGEPEDVKEYSYDPEMAKALLAEAGVSLPLDLGEFYGGSGGLAEIIQQNLADVGILVQPVSLEGYAFIMALMQGDFKLAILGGNGGYVTAAEQFSQWYQTGSTMNMAHYSNPEVDALIAALNTEQDKDKANEIIQQILDIIAEDAPYANLTIDYYYTVSNKDLNVPVSRNSLVPYGYLSWN